MFQTVIQISGLVFLRHCVYLCSWAGSAMFQAWSVESHLLGRLSRLHTRSTQEAGPICLLYIKLYL